MIHDTSELFTSKSKPSFNTKITHEPNTEQLAIKKIKTSKSKDVKHIPFNEVNMNAE